MTTVDLMKLKYIVGDATNPVGNGAKIIAHIVNDAGKFGAGFSGQLSRKFPVVGSRYHNWFAGLGHEPPFWPGTIQLIEADKDNRIYVANMLAQSGVKYSTTKRDLVMYDMLRNCLSIVGIMSQGIDATVHMPMIGTGLAGGDWNKIEFIINEELVGQGIPTTVYTLRNKR